MSHVGCMSSCHSTVTTSRCASVDDMSPSSSEELITATQDSLHDALGLESSATMVGVSQPYTVVQWCNCYSFRLSTKRTQARIVCCRVKPTASFVHSALLQFTQLYECVPDNVGYLCTNSLCVLLAAWLDASQRSRDGVRFEQVCQGVMCKAL